MPSFATGQEPGYFLPTTDIIDVQSLRGKSLDSDEFQQFIIVLTQVINNICLAVNAKDTGYYPLTEFVNSQYFFPNPALSSTTANTPSQRNVFRKIVNFGTLPNAGTTSVAHGITFTATYTATRIYGAASDVGATLRYIPIPFVDVSGAEPVGNIEINLDNTNVNITTTGNGTNFTVCYVIIEYLKN
jgi:hypothetical protein